MKRNPIKDEWCSDDGRIRLLLGDCLKILPLLKDIDAIVTDPPYGIGADQHHKRQTGGKAVTAKHNYGEHYWDSKPPEDKDLIEMTSTRSAIIWGGNYFQLGRSSRWFVWDKDNGKNEFADCELAWTNLLGAVRKFKYRWQGMLQEDMSNKEIRYHSTQKPLALMKWCLSFLPADILICDPYMGSGTTGVACIRTGRRFIGIEIDPNYYEIAKQRIIDELSRRPDQPNYSKKNIRKRLWV